MTWPQEDHADLGLIEDDNTPDMRKTPVIAGKHTTEVSSFNPTKEIEHVQYYLEPAH